MIIIKSYNNIPIRITNERLKHIYDNHPEMVNEFDKIKETLVNPEIVTEGDNGELLAIKHFSKTPVSENKYLVVVYRVIEPLNAYILTAYFTRRYNENRKILWKH
jgi:DNA repair exonuclease SbcCD nuclease subunit